MSIGKITPEQVEAIKAIVDGSAKEGTLVAIDLVKMEVFFEKEEVSYSSPEVQSAMDIIKRRHDSAFKQLVHV